MQRIDISKDHSERIDFAINNGLSTTNWQLVKLLHGGLSGANTYLIQSNDQQYAVKLEELNKPEIDLPRYIEVLAIASKQKISPHVYYANADKGVILMEYIETKPYSAGTPESIQQFAKLLHDIHHGESFPAWKSIYQILDYFYQKLSADYKQDSYIQKCMQEAKRLEELLSDPADIKPCHADINPGNVLFDGKKLYLVDWLTASPQNFYFDLACCANWYYFYSDELCSLFLKEYFTRTPTPEELHKFNLMRQFVNIYYGIGFVSMPKQSNIKLPPLEPNDIAALPSYLEFMQSLGSGKANLADPIVQQQFGYILFKESNLDHHKQFKILK